MKSMADSIIRLNVGGVSYDTTKSTLCRVPSMLESMFNGPFESKLIDGRYFIDRNGQLFQHILDYLRDGESWDVPSDLDLCRSLLREARFFCLAPLIELLETAIKSSETSTEPKINAFAMAITWNKVKCYENIPLELSDWRDKGFEDGCMVATCDQLINRAAALGYCLSSCDYINIQDINDRFILLTFESK